MAETGEKNQSKGPLVLAILIVALGVGDLLTVRGVVPGIDWAWTLGLAVVGLLAFVLSGGVDKVSVVVGPLLLAASLFSVLRQTGRLNVNTEVPLLVITLGVLIFIAQLSVVPPPRWIAPPRR
jgi:hypothetical protein